MFKLLTMTINNFDREDFLRNYWQQQPLLIRNAFPDFDNPISPEELAGLACEEDAESRLITAKNKQWHLQHGPFDETDFQHSGKKNWTLLVQAVDHWVPEVSELLNHFRFLPNWRIDDVMVSYATEGGSVGPHFDNYDVFLIQGQGSRRWQVGPEYSDSSPRQHNPQLKILANFDSQQEWVLESGDMLYVPPQFGHWGTAMDNECMTYSVGFRAPSYADLLSDFCDHRIESLKAEMRYSDKTIAAQQHPGEITSASLQTIQQILQEQLLTSSADLGNWFGCFITQPKYQANTLLDDSTTALTNEDIDAAIEQQLPLQRHPASRFAFINNTTSINLFVNGQSYPCHSPTAQQFAQQIADQNTITAAQLQSLIRCAESFKLIKTLLEQTDLYFNDDSLEHD